MGAVGQTRGPETVGGWTVTFQFAEAENLSFLGDATDPTDPLVLVPDSSVGAGDGLIVTTKDGWDYLWVYYEPVETEDVVGRQPLAAYVERVYKRTDFRRLGIG